eukprot:TRINITY_DN3730_c1_g1_i1.p1 TRINITY_DN3730_c1_g1~~TRINITY_DN3730_c1_g1_i1.p1  ORF type:complete len:257 (-),score=38.17 TRINITY_DN3730_c1_g1_i1:933-1703(-)
MTEARTMAEQESLPLLSEEHQKIYAGQMTPEEKAAEKLAAVDSGNVTCNAAEPNSEPSAPPAVVLMDKPWSTGLFECFPAENGAGDNPYASSDWETCVLACCAPCVLHGANQERLHPERPGVFRESALLYLKFFITGQVCMWCLPVPWPVACAFPQCTTYGTRTELRKKYNLQGPCWSLPGATRDSLERLPEYHSVADGDCLLHYFCHRCALAQEARELRRRVPFHSPFSVAVGQPVVAPPHEQVMGMLAREGFVL